MLPQEDSTVIAKYTDLIRLEEVCQRIKRQLEAEKARLIDEIAQYPRPIPACDAQFNYLLEKRGEILQALGQVHHVLHQELSASARAEALETLMATSRYANRE
jgi:hypothetical protein